MNCAGSGPIRSASRLGQPTSDLSTTQVPSRYSLVKYRGATPAHGSLPQSSASSSCIKQLSPTTPTREECREPPSCPACDRPSSSLLCDASNYSFRRNRKLSKNSSPCTDEAFSIITTIRSSGVIFRIAFESNAYV